jgi:hypothetical protein
VRQGVGDARASRADGGHIAIAVVEVCGDGGGGGGGAGEKLGAEGCSFGRESLIDQVAVAVVALAVRVCPPLLQATAGRETGQEQSP